MPCGFTRNKMSYDPSAVHSDVERQGWAMIHGLLNPLECRAFSGLYEQEAAFRSRIIMARHGFGQGEYRYFSYPLPAQLAHLRRELYTNLVTLANGMNERMGIGIRYPERFEDFQKRCHDAGQRRPTPLLLKYGADDYNCLHQDLYGEHVFPMQVAVLLSRPGDDFAGGEFILTEQRPRRQSRASVVPLAQGDAVVFTVRDRPVRGARGFYRVNHRHGVSTVRSGSRYTLGIIFHDAL
jgi:hypothetical protein